TVVHTTAGFIALAGLIAVGKRNKPKNSRSNIPFAALGVFILWFAWFGFNGGSILSFNDKVGLILLNTNLAAASGMAGALAVNLLLSRNGGYLISIFNGTLGGLVAITAASYYLEPMSALIIGLLSGMAVDLSSYLLDKAGIDDAVGAVPIHLFGGIAGTLLLPFFMKAEMLHTSDRLSQFLVQLLGLGVNFCWAFGMSYLMFRLIDKTVGLRITAEEEEKGLNIVEFADIYSWEKYMEISGYEKEIQDKNDLLRKQARLLAVTEEQEKTKLARDLHDGVGQSLAALKLILGMTKKQLESSVQDEQQRGNTDDKRRRSVLQNTDKAVVLTENSISEIRNVLNNLKPKPLAENGLEGGLTAMTEDINHTGTLTCSLVIQRPIPHFDETVTLNIYRVIQEALTNVVKHADAKTVQIIAGAKSSGAYDGSAGSELYAFHIQDDGIGFEANKNDFGVGIPSMADRIKMLGGKFRIDSTAGKGTRIIVEVPVADA
ncbi:MAG: histidine kinase, partial [Bacillota bacterium]|nr:histidine kinase [Bacillota bacterium]